jgi:hypothetical protein
VHESVTAGRFKVIAMTALSLCLAERRYDPDYLRSNDLLDRMRDALKTQAGTLPPEAQWHATGYGNHLLDAVAENLRALRGEDGQLN